MTAKQIRHTHDLLARSASRPVTIQAADSNRQGWIHAPAEMPGRRKSLPEAAGSLSPGPCGSKTLRDEYRQIKPADAGCCCSMAGTPRSPV
jgi:hypothetical protein